MITELYRNLGEFEKCKNILTTITNTECSWMINLFENEIAKENKKVFQLY